MSGGHLRLSTLIAATLAGCTSRPEPLSVVWIGDPSRVWALRTLQGDRVAVRPQDAATLRLDPDRTVSGTVGCNSTSSARLRWRGREGEDHGTFDTSGNGAGITTAAGCGNAAAQAVGRRFWAAIERARTWSIDGDRLTILFEDGSGAQLRAVTRPGG